MTLSMIGSARVAPFIIGLLACVSSLCLAAATTTQSRTTRTARTGSKSHATRPERPGPRARAITAEEMQGLLKRDGSHPLLLNYWATWCDPCRDEFPDLVKIDKQYRAKGLDFIA